MDLEAWAAVAAAATALVALYFSAVAARAAKKSAREAAAIATVELERREEERERRHEELAPPLSEIEVYVSVDGNGAQRLWGVVTLPRDYTVAIEPAGTDHEPPGPQDVHDILAQRPHYFQIQTPYPGRVDVEGVRIRFWPPRGPIWGPPAPPWRCYCRRPERAPKHLTADVNGRRQGWGRVDRLGGGHWELYVPLSPPTRPQGEHTSGREG